MNRILIIIIGLFMFKVSSTQYIGWNIKKISRNVRWECNCNFETIEKNKEKFEVRFPDEHDIGVTKIVFYLNERRICYGYSVYCNTDYKEKLMEYIEENYSYNAKEDFYENDKSYLFFQSDQKRKIIHVIDVNAP